MPAPTEFRVVLESTDPTSIAPGFTVVIVADDMADAQEKAEDLARTLKDFRVVEIKPGGDQPVG